MNWKPEHKDKLFKMWAEGVNKDDIQATFPDRTWKAIQSMCKYHGIKRGLPQDDYGISDLHPMYITGFVDGEGSFHANIKTGGNGLMLYFTIKLRADDRDILENIRNYFQCGTIYDARLNLSTLEKHYRKGAKPGLEYRVFRREDLEQKIIPFFEQYPLRAKKSRDFQIWRELAELRKDLKHGKRDPIHWQKIVDKVTELQEIRKYIEPQR